MLWLERRPIREQQRDQDRNHVILNEVKDLTVAVSCFD